MSILISIVYIISIVIIVKNGHKSAIEKSEAILRAKYDAQGELGKASRELMRQAGYNV